MKDRPILLLLESATEVCSVALSRGSNVLATVESSEGNRHSEWMTSYITDALDQAGLSLQDVDAIAVSEGPGSYTGLRVAYSIAKGLAYALELPIIEVNTLASMARAVTDVDSPSQESLIIPMIDARRMEVYQCLFNSNGKAIDMISATILEESLFTGYLEQYETVLLVGNGAHKVKQLALPEEQSNRIIIREEIRCSAAHLALIASEKYDDLVFADVAYCVPKYLKSPNITTSTKHRLVR